MTLGPDWRKSTLSHTNGCVEVRWQKAVACNNGNCVEVAHNTDEGMVLVRHSKHPGGGVVVFTAERWQALLDDVRVGVYVFDRFDPLRFNVLEVKAFVIGVLDGEFDLPPAIRP